MAMVEQYLPSREIMHCGLDADEKQEQQKSSYRDSIPGAPEPLCSSHDTYDDTIFDAFYDEMLDDAHAAGKPQPAPPAATTTTAATEEAAVAVVAAAPALPEKSALRASRLLDNFVLSMVQPPPTTAATTLDHHYNHRHDSLHDLYLSSEEDASSEADDWSDYEPDSESDEPEEAMHELEPPVRAVPLRRRSRETTARVVSVVFAGKPSIITVSTAAARRSISSSSGSIDAAAHRRQSSSLAGSSIIIRPSRSASPASHVSSSNASRRLSTSSMSSAGLAGPVVTAATATTTRTTLPPPARTSSLTLASLLNRPKPAFLTIDPFAGPPASQSEAGEADTPRTPKTPTAMFRRTLSLVRKRSRPVLNSGSLVTLPTEKDDEAEVREVEETTTTTTTAPTAQAPAPALSPVVPVTYQDILRVAKKNAALPSPVAAQRPASPAASTTTMTPTTAARKMFGGFSMNRRRSLKAG